MTENDELVAEASDNEDLRIEAERRLLDSHSFRTAAEMAWAICPKLESMNGERNETIRLALSIAAATSYGRPFTAQWDREGRSERGREFPTAYKEYIDSLDDASFRELHDRIVRIRHKFFAHSDASVARIEFPEDPRTAYVQIATPLSDDEAKKLQVLADNLGGCATDRYAELRDQLAANSEQEE